jgi:hypothetical protein
MWMNVGCEREDGDEVYEGRRRACEALSPPSVRLTHTALADPLARWPLARKPPDQGVNFLCYGFQIIVIHHLVISSDPPFTMFNSVTVEESLLAAVSDVGDASEACSCPSAVL